MDALKSLIRDKLRGSPAVAQLLEERPELSENPGALLQALERGVVEEIYGYLDSSLQKPQDPKSCHQATPVEEVAPPSQQPVENGMGWQLGLRLLEGQAFLDYLDDADAAGRELAWHIAFESQRFKSRQVPAVVAPRFDETIHMKLPLVGSRNGLLQHLPPVHLVLVCYGGSGSGEEPPWDTGSGTLICSHYLEWRHCLSTSGPLKMTVELQGVGKRHKLSIGVLHAELELKPVGAEPLPQLAVAAQIRAEEQQRAEVMRRCFEELDRWWSEHHMLYPSRSIRIFAQTESCLFLPVTSFVAPLHAGRHLDGPGHALHFVSLMALEQVTGEASSAEPRWHSFLAMWAKGRCTAEERALLLCSLLLGYSLDAWCCLGTDDKGQAHAWVVVRDRGDASYPSQVTFWDPQTGSRLRADDPAFLKSLCSMDTIFNHRRILVCHNEEPSQVSFDFSDHRSWLWAPVDEEMLDVLRLYPCRKCPGFADLLLHRWSPSWNVETLEEAIEDRLLAAIRTHREALGNITMVDRHLGQLLHVALVNLEYERRGMQSQSSVFENLATRVCAPGEVLRATPVQFNHLRVSLFWPALSQRSTVQEILAKPQASFAVRCRVVLQPETTVATWVLLAAKGRI